VLCGACWKTLHSCLYNRSSIERRGRSALQVSDCKPTQMKLPPTIFLKCSYRSLLAVWEELAGFCHQLAEHKSLMHIPSQSLAATSISSDSKPIQLQQVYDSRRKWLQDVFSTALRSEELRPTLGPLILSHCVLLLCS